MALTRLFALIHKKLFWILILLNVTKSRQDCSLSKFVQGTNIIFSFQCFAPNAINPQLPLQGGSSPSEFNYLDLSPNFYTNISRTDLCQFVNILTLDISFNQLTTIESLLNAFTCFTKIKYVYASNNQISTPLLSK